MPASMEEGDKTPAAPLSPPFPLAHDAMMAEPLRR